MNKIASQENIIGKREGKLSWENVKEYLGDNFGKDRLKRTVSSLEKVGRNHI